ncbi:plasmid replication DNA-binding protein [Acinetobacter junii]|uniref:plasmid replication DNA-binding protein n=1 Tax=Acinetobacter junii TaxID=40215 RepID=UPI00125F0576|nr:plasmid replication DNA-binding protein [Acinetobacter junii]
MKSLSVIELSKLYGINRQTIYNHINKGILSKNSDNKIDLSEAIRVFGEPSNKQAVNDNVKVDNQISTEVLLLRQQIDILKNQLDDAKDRESFYQNQIETMQRLLEAPKSNITTPIDPDIAPSIDPNTSREQSTTKPNESEEKPELRPQNPRIPIPEHIELEPEKRGFWSRFFRPYD